MSWIGSWPWLKAAFPGWVFLGLLFEHLCGNLTIVTVALCCLAGMIWSVLVPVLFEAIAGRRPR